MTKHKNHGELGVFEGREIIGTKIAITNAGDGLSKAMAIEPEQLSLGEKVYVVLEADVSKVAIEPVKDTDSVMRVQTLRAGTATIVDAALVKEVLDEQRIKIEEAEGVVRLDFGDGEDGEFDEAEG